MGSGGMSLSAPRAVMAATAVDAFTHALEGYTSRRSQPFADGLALEAMALIARGLVPALEGDRAARGRLLYASSLAGLVIDHTGTTVLHAMGYYLTLRHGVPHGEANGVLLPALLAHLGREIPARMAAVYRLFPNPDAGADGLRGFLLAAGIRPSLAAHGVSPSERAAFVAYVLSKKNTASTVGVLTPAELGRLFDEMA
jgi:alcohol dehydrogenase class IV